MITKLRLTKLIVLLLFFIIFNQIFLSSYLVQSKDTETGLIENLKTSDQDESKNILRKVLNLLGYTLAELRFKIFAIGNSWDFGSNTSYIEIGYNENVTFSVGIIDILDLEDIKFKDFITLQSFLASKSFTFVVSDYPSGTKDECWNILFDSPVIFLDTVGEKLHYRVNVTINLTAPPTGEKAIQSGVLRIRQTSIQQYSSFWNLYKVNGDLYSAVLFSLLFGKQIGGSVSQPELNKTRYVDILVKVKPYHKVVIDTPKIMQLNPNDVAAIPIKLTNIGNYKDTIGFRVVSNNKKIGITDPVDITLEPMASKNTVIGVGAQPDLIDYGTLHDIKIQAYSLSNPNVTIGEQEIILKTSGIYLSGYSLMLILGFLLLVIIIFFYLYSKNKVNVDLVKPDKPWDLPEEKEYLDKLKKKDKKEFDEALNQMYQEYQSSILWYKSEKDYLIKKSRLKKASKAKKTKPKKEEKKEKPKKKLIDLSKKSAKKEQKSKINLKREKSKKIDKVEDEEITKKELEPAKKQKEKPEIKIVEKEKNIDLRQKQKAIKKVLKRQEKQKKKFKRRGGQ